MPIKLDEETLLRCKKIEQEYQEKRCKYQLVLKHLNKNYIKAHQSEIDMYGHIVEIWDSI